MPPHSTTKHHTTPPYTATPPHNTRNNPTPQRSCVGSTALLMRAVWCGRCAAPTLSHMVLDDFRCNEVRPKQICCSTAVTAFRGSCTPVASVSRPALFIV
eukprot:GGOE01006010.1.p4 GENE.GGOE01006010.1~~GGOE01006010.1.p4  ORF type:complete len:100 (+),score=3.62 GGOE01006010.1:488-787(+)